MLAAYLQGVAARQPLVAFAATSFVDRVFPAVFQDPASPFLRSEPLQFLFTYGAHPEATSCGCALPGLPPRSLTAFCDA